MNGKAFILVKLDFQMKMIATNYQITVAYITICTALINTSTAEHHHHTETGISSNHDAFVTIDNILMDEDDQISTNSNVYSIKLPFV